VVQGFANGRKERECAQMVKPGARFIYSLAA